MSAYIYILIETGIGVIGRLKYIALHFGTKYVRPSDSSVGRPVPNRGVSRALIFERIRKRILP